MARRRVRDSDYLLLGVSPGASPAELLSAFRRRARAVHPDVRPDDPEAQARFQDLADAYRAAAERTASPRLVEPTLREQTQSWSRPTPPPQDPPIRATPTVVGPPSDATGGRS
jgi:hypothetical protein